MPTYRWEPTADTDNYVLERSVDKGLTWTTMATIAHDFGGANYDTETLTFFYVDATPTVGEVIRIYGTNVNGSGEPSYFAGIPTAGTRCRVYGMVLNALTGEPHSDVAVEVTPLESPAATTLQTANGFAGINAYTAVGAKCAAKLYTDNNGQWGIDLVRGISVRVEIPKVGFIREFRVPLDRDVLNIVDSHIYRTAATHPSAQSAWFYFGNVSFWR